MIAKKKVSIVSVIVSFSAVFAVGGLGTTISPLGPWYKTLTLPAWQPPGPVFGIVWTTIFVLTAISAALAWRDVDKPNAGRTLIGLFVFNGAMNLLWSFLFFKVQRPDWALMQVGFLWLSVLALIVFIAPRNKIASGLLMPYIIWVTIASVLNFDVVRLNAPFS